MSIKLVNHRRINGIKTIDDIESKLNLLCRFLYGRNVAPSKY